MDRTPLQWAALYGPLLLIGLASGALRALSLRPGLEPGKRRALTAGWILLLLVGVPAWLFAAATMGL